ncbi:MAG: TetR/AcrR family transcriptional regulator [Actinomycetota bacterium]
MTDDTRQRIVTATNELFRRRGYHGTSLSAIGQAANATTGSIYHFFPGGKEELGEAVVRETGAAYRELFEVTAGDGGPDPAEVVARFFAAAAETLAAVDFVDICPIGTVAREVASEHERLRVAADAVFESWVDAVAGVLVGDAFDGADGTDGGRGDETNRVARSTAASVIALLEGSFLLARTRRDAEVLVDAGRHAAAIVETARHSAARR